MYIIFDKDLKTKRSVEIQFFGENMSRNILNASMNKVLTPEDSNVPDLREIRSGFRTVELVDGEIAVPIQGHYNTVLDASAAYNSTTKEYSVTVVLGNQ